MVKLGLNIDHVATIRQARGGVEPDPVHAAAIAEIAGVNGITVHLREDRRHIQDRDVYILRKTIKTTLNFEMAATEEMQKIALDIMPHSCCIVPEKRQELTTEGGLDVARQKGRLEEFIKPLNKEGIIVSMFIDADEEQVKACHDIGAPCIEIHTGQYAEAFNTKKEDAEFEKIKKAFSLAKSLGLTVNAGHGLNYQNTQRMTTLEGFYEFNIGHSIISRAVMVGLDRAVKDMLEIIQ